MARLGYGRAAWPSEAAAMAPAAGHGAGTAHASAIGGRFFEIANRRAGASLPAVSRVHEAK